MSSPLVICRTVTDQNKVVFDTKVSTILNDPKWDHYTYKIQFVGDDNEFVAHILFTKLTGG
ncbi:MAG: hypothetical protein DRH97_03560 [Chloroflexi bacterium]|nr:MAG: hypothetical protein DRH97_03560 [Chloroflexota bacterium]